MFLALFCSLNLFSCRLYKRPEVLHFPEYFYRGAGVPVDLCAPEYYTW